MNFIKYFTLLLVIVALIIGQSEAAPRWKGWKKIEKAGKNVFNAAQKALPVVAGYKAVDDDDSKLANQMRIQSVAQRRIQDNLNLYDDHPLCI
uniref:CSON002659 protein n=1 Tax=Culicoides sonorensis TaxID=179676 RepID=A0A336ML04_CULSO